MAHQIDQPLRSLMIGGLYRFATCWKIERTDGTILRFTDHDQEIDFDGEIYKPAGFTTASARQSAENLDAQNIDFRGAITDDEITEDDLQVGRYREAEITEFLVDWRFGDVVKKAFQTRKYIVIETKYDGEVWQATLRGNLYRLEPKIGDVYTRTCRWDLGDANCAVDLGPHTQSSKTVSGIVVANRRFQSDVTGADGRFIAGVLTWTTGDNNGLSFDVKYFLSAGGEIELQLSTPYAIQAGDTFSIVEGCNKLVETCRDTFDNLPNFGGFPFIPGDDDLFATPDSHED